MTRDEMYDLILGAASVAIVYMLWKQHHKAAPAQPSVADAVSSELANMATPMPYAIDFGNLFDGVF